jgi:hypothetical protein
LLDTAASAALSPDFIKGIDAAGVPLDAGQMAALAGFATLAGGALAALGGANVQGAATAAQNEALNNSATHIGDGRSESQKEFDEQRARLEKEKQLLGESTTVTRDDGVAYKTGSNAIGGLGGAANSSARPVTAQNFFDGTQYTPKVLGQAALGDYHGFPESTDGFSGERSVTPIVGNDGVARWRLTIPGSYNGKSGVFEYIRNPDGTINHRLFVPNK